MSSWAEVHKIKTEYTQARSIQVQVLQHFPLVQNPSMHAFVLCNIAEIDVLMDAPFYVVQKNLDVARMIYSKNASTTDIAFCDTIQADLYLREGKQDIAKEMLEKSLKLSWGKYSELTTLIWRSSVISLVGIHFVGRTFGPQFCWRKRSNRRRDEHSRKPYSV